MVKLRVSISAVPFIVGCMLLFSAVLKSLDMGDLNRVLLFDGVPTRFIPHLSIFIIQCELGLGIALIIGIARRPVLAVTIGLFLIYSLQLSVLHASDSAPACGCLGALETFAHGQAAARWGLIRNALILVALVLYWRMHLTGRSTTRLVAPA